MTLGHLAPFGATAVAVSPDWPRERLLIALRGDAIVQTADGVEHWQSVGTPPPVDSRDVVDVLLAGPANARALFAQTSNALFRSTNQSSSWAHLVSSEDPYGPLTVRWSPDFVHDGLVLSLTDGVLRRSRNFGASWDQLHPASGEVVQDVAFSPDYARDHQLFVAVAGGTFTYSPSMLAGHPGADHDSSLGVLGSTDGGDSWSGQNSGFEIDGEPYLAVQTLAISPTFAQDGTLFAVAWGPRCPTRPRRSTTRPSHNNRPARCSLATTTPQAGQCCCP